MREIQGLSGQSPRYPLQPLSVNSVFEHKNIGAVYGVIAFIDGLLHKNGRHGSGAHFQSWFQLINYQYKLFYSTNSYPAVDAEEFHVIRTLYRPTCLFSFIIQT